MVAKERRSKAKNEWEAQPKGCAFGPVMVYIPGHEEARGREGMLMVVNSAMRCRDGRQMSRLCGTLDSTWTGGCLHRAELL